MPKVHNCIYLLFFRYICVMINFDNIDWSWIKQNVCSDTQKLRLAAHGNEKRLFEITQIDCRQRVSDKLADTLSEHPNFLFPTTLSAQQSTSDLLASYHAELTAPGWRVLDMTGGLGIDARHICKKALKVTICEIDKSVAQCAERNFQHAGIKNVEVLNCDSVAYLSQLSSDFYDCIFIDPARRGVHGERLYALSQCSPNVTAILDEMLRIAPNVIIKASPMLDITHTLSEIHHAEQIIALGTQSECKELVIICRRDFQGDTSIKSITLSAKERFCIDLPNASETSQLISFGEPIVDDYIYEPYPSVLKIGGHAFICNLFSLSKIATDSHFYCSEELHQKFPGVAHRVLWVGEMSKKTLKELPRLFPKLDVTAKNFPMTSAELSARLKVKPSGKIRLFACRNSAGKKLLIVGERL